MAQVKQSVQEGRHERGGIEIEEKQLYSDIDNDISERKTKLFAKEQMELSKIENEMRRKRSVLRSIQDPSLRKRTEDEIDRLEKSKKSRATAKYNKLRTELEVERTKQRDDIRVHAKKGRDKSVHEEQDTKSKTKTQASQQRLEADIELSHKKKEAIALEKQILEMNFEEIAEMSDGITTGAESGDEEN
jgi:hypothetical protein